MRGNPKVVPGKIGEALEFDGAGDFVDLTTLGDFGTQIGFSTFEAWIKTTNKTDWMTLINTHGDQCPNWGIELNAIHNQHEFLIMKGTLHFVISLQAEDKRSCGTGGSGGSYEVFDGEWHHIAYISEFDLRNGKGKRSIYLDGVRRSRGKSSFNGIRTFFPFTDPVYLGARNFRGKAEGFFRGAIDEVRFYDRPLTADEVIQNFESTEPYNVEPKGKLSTIWGALKAK